MIRRLTIAALAGLFCTVAVVETASALTRAESICVRGARSKARDDLRAARAQIRANLNTQYGICLNDKTGCVPACVNAQNTCLGPTVTAIAACREVCQDANQAATQACRDVPPASQVQCVEDAQLVNFNCGQDCVAAQQGIVIECNGLFNDCLENCSQ
jgi:hypothetical protein